MIARGLKIFISYYIYLWFWCISRGPTTVLKIYDLYCLYFDTDYLFFVNPLSLEQQQINHIIRLRFHFNWPALFNLFTIGKWYRSGIIGLFVYP